VWLIRLSGAPHTAIEQQYRAAHASAPIAAKRSPLDHGHFFDRNKQPRFRRLFDFDDLPPCHLHSDGGLFRLGLVLGQMASALRHCKSFRRAMALFRLFRPNSLHRRRGQWTDVKLRRVHYFRLCSHSPSSGSGTPVVTKKVIGPPCPSPSCGWTGSTNRPRQGWVQLRRRGRSVILGADEQGR
jgi:hypothetical protein